MWREKGSRLSVGWTWKCHWRWPRHGWAGRGGTRGSLAIYRLTATISTAPVRVSTRGLSGLLWKNHRYFYFSCLVSVAADLKLPSFPCVENPQCPNTHNKSQIKDLLAVHSRPELGKQFRFCIFSTNQAVILGWAEDFSRTCQGLFSLWCLGIFVTIFSKHLKIKGQKWMGGKIHCTEKLQNFGSWGILKTSSFDWSSLTALQTVYIGSSIFWGEKLFSAKISNRSVAVSQMDLVQLMFQGSPVCSDFCHSVMD